MSGSGRKPGEQWEREPDQPLLDDDDVDLDEEPRFFEDPKRLAQTMAFVLLLIVGIYFLLPKILSDQDATARLDDANWAWVLVAFWFAVIMFIAYVALFRGVVGRAVRLRWKDSYDITMAGLAATRLFSAGGAGGIVLTYWALRKAGMPRKETAARMVAFLVLLYAVYMVTLLVNGILMSTGVFEGPAPPGLTIVPAAFAGVVIVIFLLLALVPGDLERRISEASQEHFWGRTARSAPAGRSRSPAISRAVGLRSPARSASGPPRSASSGRRSRPSTSTSRSRSSSRGSSLACSRT